MAQFVPTLNLDEEVRLWTNNRQREQVENLADLFSIIVTLDCLEKAYTRDSISQEEYAPACLRLLAQSKTILRLVQDNVTDIPTFMKDYRMNCPAAAHRLSIGIPATVEHVTHQGIETGKIVAETTSCFITTLDALKVNYRAKDQLHPLLSDLMSNYNKFKASETWEGRGRLLNWLITLNQMKASDELSDGQARQEMQFDLDTAYNEFYRSLSKS